MMMMMMRRWKAPPAPLVGWLNTAGEPATVFFNVIPITRCHQSHFWSCIRVKEFITTLMTGTAVSKTMSDKEDGEGGAEDIEHPNHKIKLNIASHPHWRGTGSQSKHWINQNSSIVMAFMLLSLQLTLNQKVCSSKTLSSVNFFLFLLLCWLENEFENWLKHWFCHHSELWPMCTLNCELKRLLDNQRPLLLLYYLSRQLSRWTSCSNQTSSKFQISIFSRLRNEILPLFLTWHSNQDWVPFRCVGDFTKCRRMFFFEQMVSKVSKAQLIRHQPGIVLFFVGWNDNRTWTLKIYYR